MHRSWINWPGHSTTVWNMPQTGSPARMKDTVSDQASHSRDLYHDGLGRLTAVVEDPASLAYATSYDYNALDNLTSVVQGTQSRSFVYDSLQRLTSSLQPEMNPNGKGPALAASYTYTNDGLPLTRTDGNGITTSYTYDKLNRLTEETHRGTGSDRSATITRCYDGLVATAAGTCAAPSGFTIPYAAGRLTATRSDLSGAPAVTSTTTYKAYDQLGRVLTSEQVTNGSGPYGFDYAYDLAGGLTGFTNETTGRTIWTGYNNLDQPTDVSGQCRRWNVNGLCAGSALCAARGFGAGYDEPGFALVDGCMGL
jgi:YD repeat-containing protein